MNIDKNLVEYVARLSRLKLTDEEKKVIVPQFREIVEYVEKLSQLNVENVPPMDHVLDLQNVYREDRSQESLPRVEILKNAPKSDGQFFEVPKII